MTLDAVVSALSKREYFASVALEGLLSNPNSLVLRGGPVALSENDRQGLVNEAVSLADRLIRRLDEES